MSKEAEEFYPIWVKGLKERFTEREIISIHMQDDFHILFAEAYAKHYAKRLAKKVYKKLSEFDEGESHYKNQDVEEQYNHEAYGYSCGLDDFKRKLIKQIEG